MARHSDKVKHRKRQQGGRARAFLGVMFALFRYYLDLLIDGIFGLYYNSRVVALKGTDNPLVCESGTSLARKIRTRAVTSEEVVTAFIQRIKEVNPLINAVVDNRFEEALKEARLIDEEIASGTVSQSYFNAKPFLGVPFTTKESTAAKGMSHTFGLISRKNKKASYDAEVIEKMKGSGAILIAVTNVPQLNLWVETSNPVYGITNNPYNNTRNVGGSSGGEASVIAAGGSPFGIGTDIGGSLRIPAFMCGIYGHKPTCDLISTNGLTFRTGEETNTMVVAGPMTKHAEDIIPFLKVLVGEKVTKLKLDANVKVTDLKIFYISDPKDPFVSPIRDEMKSVFNKVLDHFNEASALEIESLKFGGKLWRYWMTQEPNANFNRDLTNRESVLNSYSEIIKYFLGSSQFNFAVIFNLLNGFLPREKSAWAKEQTDLIRAKLLETLGTNGVLLYPSAPWTASYHHAAFLRPWNFNLFSVWNALKFPVTQVPLGLGKDGLPLGIQVVAAPYQDHLAIAVAKELEKAFGGYVAPFVTSK